MMKNQSKDTNNNSKPGRCEAFTPTSCPWNNEFCIQIKLNAGDTHVNLIKLAKVHGVEAVYGRPDVLAVGALLHHLQLPHAWDVRQPRLDLCHVGDLQESEGISPQKRSNSITLATDLQVNGKTGPLPLLSLPTDWVVSTTTTSQTGSHHSYRGQSHLGCPHRWRWRSWRPYFLLYRLLDMLSCTPAAKHVVMWGKCGEFPAAETVKKQMLG